MRIFTLAIILLLQGCASPVVTDSKPGVDFSRYQQFSLHSINHDEPQTLDEQRTEQALSDALTERGFQLVEKDGDALVRYFFKPEQRFQGRAVQFGVGVFRSPVGVSTQTPIEGQTIEEYRLVIQFIDRRSQRVFWQGNSRDKLRDEMSSERREAIIQQAVTEMIKRYPGGQP